RNPEDCRFESEMPASAPAITAPALAGRVLKAKETIEEELFHWRAENINVEIDGRQLQFTNLNKVYFPESGYTKRDLLAYYYRMAERVLPFLQDRPLVLRRYPNGITQKSFFQKEAGETAPKWMKTVAVASEEKRQRTHYFRANERASILQR